jgi:hypothetical protein
MGDRRVTDDAGAPLMNFKAPQEPRRNLTQPRPLDASKT